MSLLVYGSNHLTFDSVAVSIEEISTNRPETSLDNRISFQTRPIRYQKIDYNILMW